MYFIPLIVIIIIWLPLLFILRWRYYRMPLLPKVDKAKESDEALPITIIIPLEHDVESLYELLTSIFNQHYEGTIHVLIANYSGEKVVEEKLLRLERDFRHLKHTNIATTTHLIDREKLAVSIGIKGARTEWIMLMDADVLPPSPNWLKAMMQTCEPDCDIAIGYSNCAVSNSDTSLWNYDVHLQNILNYKTSRQNCYTGGFLTHVLVRKSLFIEQKGFSIQHTRLTIGTLPLLVEHLSKTGRVRVILSADTCVFRKQSPTNDYQQEALAHNIIYYYTATKTKVLDAMYSISTCILLTLPIILLYVIIQNVVLWMNHSGSITIVSAFTFTPNSPMIWEVILHTMLVVALFVIFFIPIRRLHISFASVGFHITYPKLLIYPFLLPIYRANKRILAFFYRKKCVRRL